MKESGFMNMDIKGRNQYTKRIIQTGLFLALALVIRNLAYMIYIGGAPGMRVSFSGIFTKLPALLFGPMYGGMAAGIVDVLGYMMKPEGGFIPWLTVTAVFGGLLTGLLWKLFKNLNYKKVQVGFLIFFVVAGVIGLVNHIAIFLYPNSYLGKAIINIGKSKDFASIGLEVISLIGLAILSIDVIIRKKQNNFIIHENFLKVLIATGIAGIIVTTLNTYILQIFIPALGKRGFMVFWIPRLIQEILMSIIQAYIISFLLSIYYKVIRNNE